MCSTRWSACLGSKAWMPTCTASSFVAQLPPGQEGQVGCSRGQPCPPTGSAGWAQHAPHTFVGTSLRADLFMNLKLFDPLSNGGPQEVELLMFSDKRHLLPYLLCNNEPGVPPGSGARAPITQTNSRHMRAGSLEAESCRLQSQRPKEFKLPPFAQRSANRHTFVLQRTRALA